MNATDDPMALIVSDDLEGDQFEAAAGSYLTRDPRKLRVECVCPLCRQKHLMSIHWIGRGTPRKFCDRCREQSESHSLGD